MKKTIKKLTRTVIALAICLTQVLPTFKVVADTTPTPITGRTSSDYVLAAENVTSPVLTYDNMTKVLDISGTEVKKVTVGTDEGHFVKLDVNLPSGYVYDAQANEVSYTLGNSISDTIALIDTDDKISITFDVLEALALREIDDTIKLEITWGQNFEVETLYLDLTDLVLYRLIEAGASSSKTEYLEVAKNASGEYDVIYDSDTSSTYPNLYLIYEGTGFEEATSYKMNVDLVFNPSFTTTTYETSTPVVTDQVVTGEELADGLSLQIETKEHSLNGKYEYTITVFDDTGATMLDKLVYVVNLNGFSSYISGFDDTNSTLGDNVKYSDDSDVTKDATTGVFQVKESEFPTDLQGAITDKEVTIKFMIGNINPDEEYIVISKLNGININYTQDMGGELMDLLFEETLDFSDKVAGNYVYEVIVKDELGERIITTMNFSYINDDSDDTNDHVEDFTTIPSDEDEQFRFLINYGALAEADKALLANRAEIETLYINYIKESIDFYIEGLNNSYYSESNVEYKENVLDIIMGYAVFGNLDSEGNMIYVTKTASEVKEDLLANVANGFRGADLAFTITILDSEGNALEDDQVVTTGCVIRINFLENEVDYTILLFGNATSADGTFSNSEIELIVGSYVDGTNLSAYQEIALDSNLDETMNVLDLTAMITLNEGGSI